MAITKEKKKKILEELRNKIKKQKAIIFVDFSGLKNTDLSSLRKKLKEIGDEIKVVKKTLASIILKEKNIEIDLKKMKGELALVFGYKEEILPAKTIFQFSQEKPNLKILGGFLENKFFDKERIIELAKLPTKEELLENLARNLSAPIFNFVNVLSANLRNFVYVLDQIQKVKK